MPLSFMIPFSISDEIYNSLDDISIVMKSRVLAGYGLNVTKNQDQELKLPLDLVRLWNWIRLVKRFHEANRFKLLDDEYSGSQITLIGIRGIIRGLLSGECQRSDHHYSPWVGIEAGNSSVSLLKIPHYKSEDRSKALYLCGWGDSDTGIEVLLDSLESSGEFSRAAAIAIFNLRIKRAIQALSKGAQKPVDKGGDPHYNVVAMALAGFNDKSSLWKEMCRPLGRQLSDSYLKAIFTFLTCDNNDHEEILNDPDLRLADRVAFACTFLSDHKLLMFLEIETSRLVKRGDLSGLLLTGVPDDGLELLQRYVEETSDVQSASLIILHALPGDVHEDLRAKSWVESYRAFLNQWRLWHQRALFDIEWYKRLSNESPPQQLFISCNFCDKNVSSYLRLVGRSRQGLEQQQQQLQLQQQHQAQQHYQGKISMSSSTNKTRMQSCPNCRKALPRCALCLTHLGTPALHWRSSEFCHIQQEPSKKRSPFNNWFTWCQTCRHGGHSQHIIAWFKEHVECPVTGCTCRCMAVDNVSRIGSDGNQARTDSLP